MDGPVPERRLSKSRYLHGLQCLKQLWWRVHEPDAYELVPSLETSRTIRRGASSRRAGAAPLSRRHPDRRVAP